VRFDVIAQEAKSSEIQEPEAGTPRQTSNGPESRHSLHKIKGFLNRISDRTKLKLKLLVSLVLFSSLFLFGKIDLSASWAAALSANKGFVALSVILLLASILPQARRWQLLAGAVGFPRPLYKLVQYCYVGGFFNLFFPSTVGGDFSRVYYISKGTGRYKQAFYSVLADRALGISVLFFMATVGLLLGPGGQSLSWQLKLPVFVGTICILCGLPFAPYLARKILGEQHWLSQRFNNSAASIYWKDKPLMIAALVWTCVMQFMMVAVHIALGFALGLTTVPLWYYFVFYPCVAVLGFVTPSFNGIGIREWAYTYFLTMVGVDKAIALTYAIMWLGLVSLLSLTGGLVYVAGHLKISAEEVEKIQKGSLK
jgi:glycosyltransferase 2 family protein